MTSNQPLSDLQRALNIHFNREELLLQAFTHSSHVNEHKACGDRDNERLEFLGDAVLELAVSEYLYNHYSDLSEGELTKMRAAIVCEASLKQFAQHLQFGDYVLLGKGEENTGGRTRPALLADLFEAFIGALYLDQGFDAVRSFLNEHLFSRLSDLSSQTLFDYKTELQEWMQKRGMGSPRYEIVEESGPAHDRAFTAEVYTEDKVWGQGKGRSKKEAEQQAASNALRLLKNLSNPQS